MGLTSIVKKGTTGYILEVAIRALATNQLLTGLAAADMTIRYQRQGAAAHVSVTPVAGVLGTWASGSWVESVPGIYQFGVPDAALAEGADFVIIVFTSTHALDEDASIYLTASELIGIGESVSTTYILTSAESALVLRVADDDPAMLELLPSVDRYIKNATGRDWAAESPIREEAKAAARILLVQWYEDPGMIGVHETGLELGAQAALLQLEAIALQTKKIRFRGRVGTGACKCKHAAEGDIVAAVVGIVGETGDQAAAFEAVITKKEQIQQTSTADLSEKEYLAFLQDPEAVDYPATP